MVFEGAIDALLLRCATCMGPRLDGLEATMADRDGDKGPIAGKREAQEKLVVYKRGRGLMR